jgi:hypothetical protein
MEMTLEQQHGKDSATIYQEARRQRNIRNCQSCAHLPDPYVVVLARSSGLVFHLHPKVGHERKGAPYLAENVIVTVGLAGHDMRKHRQSFSRHQHYNVSEALETFMLQVRLPTH